MEQLTGSKLGKNYEKVDNFYVVYIVWNAMLDKL